MLRSVGFNTLYMRIGLFVTLALFAALAFLPLGSSRTRPEMVVAGGPNAEAIDSVDCGPGRGKTADVTFSLAPNAEAVERWIDVSVYDDGFVPGTYFTSGVDPKATSYTWRGLLANVAWFWQLSTQTADGWTATETHVLVPCAAAELQASVEACSDQETTAVFDWRQAPGGIEHQYLDISVFDNGFLPGTFASFGPLDGTVDSVKWPGLPVGRLFWRVNSQTGNGWMTSETRAVSSCGVPDTREPRYRCLPDSATVEFRWAPSKPPAQGQWLDVTTNFNGFEAGTFDTTGPFEGDRDTFVWAGFQPSVPVYFRVNASTPSGWKTSVTRRFVADCPAPALP